MEYFLIFLKQYKYFAIAPAAILEGPVISIVTGFLASRGVLSLWVGLLVVFIGDFISDSVLYLIGRKGKPFVNRLKFLGVTEEKIQGVENQYERSPWKTMIVAKVSYGLGTPFIISAGLSKMSLKSFFWYIGILNFIRSLALVLLGYYFGKAALRLSEEYLGWYTFAVIITVPTLWYITKRLQERKDKKNI